MPNNPERSASGFAQTFETKVKRVLQAGRGFQEYREPRHAEPSHRERRHGDPRYSDPRYGDPWEHVAHHPSLDKQLAVITGVINRLNRRVYQSADQIEKLLTLHQSRFNAALNDVTQAAAHIRKLRDEIEACRRQLADITRELDESRREYEPEPKYYEPRYSDSPLGSSDLLQREHDYQEGVMSEAALPEESISSELQVERKKKKGGRSNPESEQS